MRKWFVGLAVSALLLGGGAGVAMAQGGGGSGGSSGSTSTTQGPSQNGGNQRHPLAAKVKASLDKLVQDKKITQDQEDLILKTIAQDLRGAGHGRSRKVLRRAVEVAAKTIGISPQDLGSQLKAGKSIAEVAQAHNVDEQKVIDAIVSAANTRIDAAVKSGKFSQDRANALKQRLPTIAKKLVERTKKH